LSDNDPQQDLITSSRSDTGTAPAPKPEPALNGTGPVLIAPQNSTTPAPAEPGYASLPSVPDSTTTIRKTRLVRSGSKSADLGRVGVSTSNFNRQAPQQQIAAIEPGWLNPEIATDPPPQAPAQQASLPPSPPSQSTPSEAAPQTPGFVMIFSSHRSEADAMAEFERLRQSHAGLVGSLTPSVRKTNLGSSGTRYQLSLGVIPTREAAKNLCTSLFAAGEKDCIVRPR
jgi:hypothetical protein